MDIDMSFEDALRLTEIALGFAFLQQSLEHLHGLRAGRGLFIARSILSVLLMVGIGTEWVCLALFVLALCMLKRFQGPYNGGSDRMSLLIICGLCLAHFAPSRYWQEVAFGYIALQLVLSYFIAGWVKIVNPDWRSGRALRDVFLFSTYPVCEAMRAWTDRPRVLWIASWAVMLFELLFPLTLIAQTTLAVGLVIAACFHFSNACFFGFNRFFWIWMAAYPSIIWLQQRILM